MKLWGAWRLGVLMTLIATIVPSLCLADTSAILSSLAFRVTRLENILINDLPPDARWALTVSLSGEGVRFAAGEHAAGLEPGSAVKLFIAAAALEANADTPLLMETVVAYHGEIRDGILYGDVVLTGHGNAFLSDENMVMAAEALVSSGLRKIIGDVIADDSYLVASLEPRYRGPAYATPGALGMYLHTVSLRKRDNDVIRVIPENKYIKIAVDATLDEVHCIDDVLYRVPDGNFSRRCELNDPALYAAQSFLTQLEAAGIVVEGRVQKAASGSLQTIAYVIPSPSLDEIVVDMNTHSLNVVAENLLLVLGAETYGAPGTLDRGLDALRRIYVSGADDSTSAIVLVDGSGVSRDNRLSTDALVAMLEVAAGKPWFGTFHRSLPRYGYEGTVRSTEYRNDRVRVKTGRTSTALSLSGYGRPDAESLVAFSFIINSKAADRLSWVSDMVIRTLFNGDVGSL